MEFCPVMLTFTPAELTPSNVQLLSLNRSSSKATIGWTFNKVMSLREQGGKLHLVYLEVPPNSFLAKEIEEEQAEANAPILYESSTEGVETRLIGESRQRKMVDQSGSVVPASTLSALSDWSTLQQFVASNSSHSGTLELELQDKVRRVTQTKKRFVKYHGCLPCSK